MIIDDNKHIFAIYSKILTSIVKNNKLEEIKSIHEIHDKIDEELINRIVNILRLRIGERFIIFNNQYHAELLLVNISKRSITVEILSIDNNKHINPIITWGLPILKRADFEESLYNLGQLGVQYIQLLNTDKSQKWFSADGKDMSRSEKILIASSEQSKNYNIPQLLAPINFDKFIIESNIIDQAKISFDIDTEFTCKDLINNVNKYKNLLVISGPEGDLTIKEKNILKASGFISYKLTPTVLKAAEAITVGAGILRSFLD